MRDFKKATKKTWLLTGAALATAIVLVAVYLYTHRPHNTLEQNKKIEIQAVQEKNASKCNDIRGNSYYINGVDGQTIISQTEAQKECRDNVRRDIVPPLMGI